MTWNCLIEVQRRLGANSLIGRELFPLITDAGFARVRVEPKMVYIGPIPSGAYGEFCSQDDYSYGRRRQGSTP